MQTLIHNNDAMIMNEDLFWLFGILYNNNFNVGIAILFLIQFFVMS
jgi:hypothetical protein